jgi:dolichol-phosphate mannosyltransferase
MDTNAITLLLPAYDEQEALPPLLAAIAETRARDLSSIELIVVDDGSRDNTAQVVRDFNQPWVRLVQHPRNMGLAQAMRTGLRAALERAPPGGLIAAMDADNSHQPHELLQMLRKLESGLDVVIGSRFQPGAKMAGIPPHRQLFSWGVSVLFQVFTPIPGVRDFSCGYRLYRASALRRAADRWGDRLITEQGFACMTELLLKLSLIPDLRFGETPMDLRYDRKPGPTKMKVWQNIKDMMALMWRHRWSASARSRQ